MAPLEEIFWRCADLQPVIFVTPTIGSYARIIGRASPPFGDTGSSVCQGSVSNAMLCLNGLCPFVTIFVSTISLSAHYPAKILLDIWNLLYYLIYGIYYTIRCIGITTFSECDTRGACRVEPAAEYFIIIHLMVSRSCLSRPPAMSNLSPLLPTARHPALTRRFLTSRLCSSTFTAFLTATVRTR